MIKKYYFFILFAWYLSTEYIYSMEENISEQKQEELNQIIEQLKPSITGRSQRVYTIDREFVNAQLEQFNAKYKDSEEEVLNKLRCQDELLYKLEKQHKQQLEEWNRQYEGNQEFLKKGHEFLLKSHENYRKLVEDGINQLNEIQSKKPN